MTLIASIQRPEGILTVSDVMLSSERRGLKPSVDLPLRGQDLFRSFDPSRSTETNPSPVGIAQKTVLLEPNGMALWAGSHTIASAVLKDLAAAYAQGQRPCLDHVVQSSGISQSEADQISVIAFLDHGDSIVQQVLNTERLERPSGSIVHAGTGSYPGIIDIDDGALAGDIADFHRTYLNRLMIMLSGELIIQDNADFSFGGWFELAQLGVGGTFSKIPYAVKLWLVDEDRVGDGPALVSGYVRNDLVVFYLDRNAPAARLPYFVPDFLRRSGRTSWHGEAPDHEHAFEFHVIHFNDLKRTALLLLGGPQRVITMEVRRDSLAWGVDPEFLKLFVRETRESGPAGFRLSRLSTWKD
jgi:hypothetical protein